MKAVILALLRLQLPELCFICSPRWCYADCAGQVLPGMCNKAQQQPLVQRTDLPVQVQRQVRVLPLVTLPPTAPEC